jgi:hypothetical protein
MLRHSLVIFALITTLIACESNSEPPRPPDKSPMTRPAATRPSAAPAPAGLFPPGANEVSLFDGKSLGQWKSTEFGGESEVLVEDGKIIVHSGATLSGVNWTGPALPTENYEIELDAMKLDGSDFFLGLTFPYKKDYASLILGGWGGGVVGISSVNGFDAANNEFSTALEFTKNTWYHVRLRVTTDKIRAWISGHEDPVLDVETEGKEISTRSDIDAAKPLGLSTYQTSAAYKNIKIRKL